MIHYKNHNGFTLIEATVAIAIAVIILTPLFILQGVVLQGVHRGSRKLHRIFLGKHVLYEARRAMGPEAREFTLEKKIDDPQTVIKYELRPLRGKSSLHEVNNLYVERVTIKWQDPRGKREEQLIGFVYKPEQKKK